MAVGMAVATMGRDDAAAGEECAGSDELPDEAWREITLAEGSQGPRSYMFSARRVRVTKRRKPGNEAEVSKASAQIWQSRAGMKSTVEWMVPARRALPTWKRRRYLLADRLWRPPGSAAP